MTAASTLVTAFETRYSSHVQASWSRQDDPGNAGSSASTVLTAAAEDAIEMYEYETGVAFDSANNICIMIGCRLMHYHLMLGARNYEGATSFMAQIKPMLEKIEKRRARVISVDANTDQRAPTTPSRTVKPDFDEDGSFWDEFGINDASSTSALEENFPFSGS